MLLHIFLKRAWNICKAKNVQLFSDSSLAAIAPYPLNSTSSALLVEISEENNAIFLSYYYFGVLLSKNYMTI